eukprot:CAMPEP_0184692520 /NCGR_PEP_ID=MMETSP0313-20130426/969_1 /TAXON_ID=2792 /ORGANISM="Porphyridium aerugineum, Strain SAG 1380-2" /LENGTH=266 /DNA_ID=CAMNT_0027150357 /DNA_START=169 /DNA_END=969 /DNA_ORIENTATION=+
MSAFWRLARYEIGIWIQETGLALDRLGMRLQGDRSFVEKLSRHRQVMTVGDTRPLIKGNVFLAPNASVIGEVTLEESANVWYSAVLRGDHGLIHVGKGSNIQDHATVLTFQLEKRNSNVIIGDDVTIGHGSVIRAGSRIGNGALIGMNAVLMECSTVESRAMLAANSVLQTGSVVPEGEMWAGNPAKLKRKLTQEELSSLTQNSVQYVLLSQTHQAANGLTPEQIDAVQKRDVIAQERQVIKREDLDIDMEKEALPAPVQAHHSSH